MLNEEKRSEVLAFFWFVVSVLTLLSLVSYTPADIRFEVSLPNAPAKNFVGVAGAYAAWALFLFFGHVAYIITPLLLAWSFTRWAGKKSQKFWLKLFATVILFTSACALFSLWGRNASATSRFHAGGILGFFTANFLSSFFGKAGFFVAASLFILSIILATELLILQAVAGLINKFIKHIDLNALAKDEEAQKPAAKFGQKPAVQSTVLPQQPKPAAAKPQPVKPVDVKKPEPVAEAPKPLPVKPEIKVSLPRQQEMKAPPVPKPAVIIEDGEEMPYTLPSIDLLEVPPAMDNAKMTEGLEESSRVLEDTLRDFGIDAKVVSVEQGPTITRYELQPAAGVKVQKITALENDIALVMRATSVRIVAPIPGKNLVGVEVPSSINSTVYLREVMTSPEYQKETSKIAIVIGKDIGGAPLTCNLGDMPHLLIAGATNTGKSVCINSLISSLLFRATPEEVKFIMIDPKMVELHFYNDLPHLITPVITDKAKAPAALAWLLSEMERRYKVLSKVGAKNIAAFNDKVVKKEIRPENLTMTPDNQDEPVLVKKMPYIVVVIDELADLMMASANEVETAITRLAQLARAVGIHMVLATQRPSVDVITGVIKANFPARIAFQVASKVDSRTILDENGADKLLGRGDLLFMDPRKSKLIRAQGAWVQDKEIEKLTSFIKNQRKTSYTENVTSAAKKGLTPGGFEKDEVYDQAVRVVLESGQASVSMVQRRLGVGYTRAARLIDMMEEEGIVGPYRGAKPRDILVERPNAKKPEEVKEGSQ